MDEAKSRVERASAWIAEQSDEIRKALASLVEVNSHTANVDGGNRVGQILRDLFESDELACDIRSSSVHADHLVFRTRAPGAPIALVGHLDTVFPPGSFEGFRRDGPLARGPGVLDMKGGLLVAGFALLALGHIGALENLPVRFVIVSDEEVGSPEGQPLLRAVAGDASCGLVFEAGGAGGAPGGQRPRNGGRTPPAPRRGPPARHPPLHDAGGGLGPAPV